MYIISPFFEITTQCKSPYRLSSAVAKRSVSMTLTWQRINAVEIFAPNEVNKSLIRILNSFFFLDKDQVSKSSTILVRSLDPFTQIYNKNRFYHDQRGKISTVS